MASVTHDIAARLIDIRMRDRARGRTRQAPTWTRSVSSPCRRRSRRTWSGRRSTPRQIDFGENKVQDGLQKIEQTADLPLRWHLIGHLQSNKAKKAPALRSLHAVDSVDLLQAAGPRRRGERCQANAPGSGRPGG